MQPINAPTFLDDLKDSNEFLCLLLEHMNSAVLIVDQDLCIHQFNNAFSSLFGRTEQFDDLTAFGQAAGCMNSVLEEKACGATSQCADCVFRESILHTITDDVPTDKRRVRHTFRVGGRDMVKHLELTTRTITYRDRSMVLAILYDVTILEEQRAELARKQEQLDRELEAAAAVQQNLLPLESPSIPGLDLHWSYRPCSEVGGDLVSVLYLDAEHIALSVLDVCGHGVASGLVAMGVAQFLQTRYGIVGYREGEMRPRRVMAELDSAFPFERFNSFFSIVYMVVHLRTGQVTFSSAGHPPALLLPAQGEPRPLNPTGPVIGVMGGKVDEDSFAMNPGDCVVLYTDGVLEHHNDAGEQYGLDRLLAAARACSGCTAREMVEKLERDVRDFGGARPFDDDVTFLVFSFTGEASASCPCPE